MLTENGGSQLTLQQILEGVGAFLSGLLGGHWFGKSRATERKFDDEARDFIRQTVHHQFVNSPDILALASQVRELRLQVQELPRREEIRGIVRAALRESSGD